MAISTAGKAVSLSWTRVGGAGPAGPITKIRSMDSSRKKELVTALEGNAEVDSHYAAKKTGMIQVTCTDIAAYAQFEEGQKFTGVTLTVQSARDSAGSELGTNVTQVLSHAVLEELGNLSKDNTDNAPATYVLTFRLSRFEGASADPTCTMS